MDQSTQKTKVDLVLQAAAKTDEGLVLNDVLAIPGLAGERRKAQRLLQSLVEDGRLRKEGATRGTRYWLATPPAQSSTPVEDYPPLSAASVVLRDAIRKPLSQRTPVAYSVDSLTPISPTRPTTSRRRPGLT